MHYYIDKEKCGILCNNLKMYETVILTWTELNIVSSMMLDSIISEYIYTNTIQYIYTFLYIYSGYILWKHIQKYIHRIMMEEPNGSIYSLRWLQCSQMC